MLLCFVGQELASPGSYKPGAPGSRFSHREEPAPPPGRAAQGPSAVLTPTRRVWGCHSRGRRGPPCHTPAPCPTSHTLEPPQGHRPPHSSHPLLHSRALAGRREHSSPQVVGMHLHIPSGPRCGWGALLYIWINYMQHTYNIHVGIHVHVCFCTEKI